MRSWQTALSASGFSPFVTEDFVTSNNLPMGRKIGKSVGNTKMRMTLKGFCVAHFTVMLFCTANS